MIRLPYDANCKADVLQYYATRSKQLLHENYRWSGQLEWTSGFEGKVYETHFEHGSTEKRYVSYYILPTARGQGVLKHLVTRGQDILTLKDCHIEGALEHLGASFVVAGRLTETREYQLVEAFYNDRRTWRSQVFLMNHIDEGLGVMAAEGASDEAMRAFCLHPLLQDDVSLAANYDRVCVALEDAPRGAFVVGLAMEYRSVANEYLAHAKMPEGGIRLSPLKDVLDMLIGDKVQNRKDFELYHAQSHENRTRLAEYFNEWCTALGVAERYDSFKTMLS